MKNCNCSSIAFLILVVLVAISASFCARRVNAQATMTPTPTNTLTPTPDVVDEVDIDGDIFFIERRVTYGEIAVVIAVLAVLLPIIVFFTFKIITHYLR